MAGICTMHLAANVGEISHSGFLFCLPRLSIAVLILICKLYILLIILVVYNYSDRSARMFNFGSEDFYDHDQPGLW